MPDPSYANEPYSSQPLPSSPYPIMNPYAAASPPTAYAPSSSSYLAPESYSHHHSTYHLSPSHGYSSSAGYISHGGSSVGSNNSPSSQVLDDFDDREDAGYDAGYPDYGIASYPRESGSSSYHHHQTVSSGAASGVHPDEAPYYMCDYTGCGKVCARQCDLRKHKKRHQKPFMCRDGCDSYFSTEKDRDRHERSKHRREERLTCAVCGHRTARKDNMKDHVRRRHGEHDLERIMDATMNNAYP